MKYQDIFAKVYTPNWSEEVFMIKKFENTVPSRIFNNDLNGEKVVETFYEKELKKNKWKTAWDLKSNQEKRQSTIC